MKQSLKSKPFQFTLALFDKSSIDLCTTLLLCKVYQLCLEGLSAMPVIHTITEIRSAASPYTSVCTGTQAKPLLLLSCSSRSHPPRPHTTFTDISFFYDCLTPFLFSLSLPLLPFPPSFSPSLCLSSPLSLSPPFCGWQSPWDYAHS